jgi:hypothetical protein
MDVEVGTFIAVISGAGTNVQRKAAPEGIPVRIPIAQEMGQGRRYISAWTTTTVSRIADIS